MKQVVCALLFFLVACREEQQPPIVAADPTFEQAWNEDVGKVALASVGPRKVFTEKILPTTDDPKAMPEAVMNPEPQVALSKPKVSRFIRVKEARRERHEKKVHDVCQRHGQRKVFTGKYKWRCRK